MKKSILTTGVTGLYFLFFYFFITALTISCSCEIPMEPTTSTNEVDYSIDLTITTPTNAIYQSNFTATFRFKNKVTNFHVDDIQILGGELHQLQVVSNQLLYTAEIFRNLFNSPVSIIIPPNRFFNLQGTPNSNAYTNSIAFVDTLSELQIVFNALAIRKTNFTISFSFIEPVGGFEPSDINIIGGELSNFLAVSNNLLYTAEVFRRPFTNVVMLNVASNSFYNLNSIVSNTNSYSQVIPFEAEPIGLDILPMANAIHHSNFTVTFTFLNPAFGFEVEDIDITGGLLSEFESISETRYTVLVKRDSLNITNVVTLSVASNRFFNSQGLSNQESYSRSIDYLGDPLGLTITSDHTDLSQTRFTVTFAFLNAVSDFDSNDIEISRGHLSNFRLINNTNYTVEVNRNSTTTISIPPGRFSNRQGLSNSQNHRLLILFEARVTLGGREIDLPDGLLLTDIFHQVSKPTFVDFNNDGQEDLVVGQQNRYLAVYERQGDRYFPLVGSANPFDGIRSAGNGSSPAFGDVDGDGDKDLVLGSGGSPFNLQYYRNTGSAWVELTNDDNPFNDININNNSSSANITIIDDDGNGRLGLVIASLLEFTGYFNNGGGVWVTNPDFFYSAGTSFINPAFLDFDDDGDLDVFLGIASDFVRALRNDGDGRWVNLFEDPSNPFGLSNQPSLSGTGELINGGNSTSTSLSDLDGDGDLDLVLGSGGLNLIVYRNTEGGWIRETKENSFNPFDDIDLVFQSAPTFVDVDGDNDPDLVVGASDGMIYFYRNTGTAWVEVTGTNNPFDGIDIGSQSAPTFTDVDGDNDLDLVVGDVNGMIHFYRNTGTDWVEVTGTNNPFDDIDVGLNTTPTFVDVDGDNDPDLVVGALDGMIYFYRNTGTAWVEVTGTNNPFDGIDIGNISAPTFADMDGDDDMDLVVGGFNGTIQAYQNDNGVFTWSQLLSDIVAIATVTSDNKPTFADVDGDGDLDLVVGLLLGEVYFFINVAGPGEEMVLLPVP